MDIIRFDPLHLPIPEPHLSLALGNFDAFHKGHALVFLETSLGSEGTSAVLLFAKPYGEGEVLTSLEDKLRFCNHTRLDRVYVLENDDSLFRLTAGEFIQRILLPLGTERVVIGEDFRFGKDQGGGIEELKERFKVEVVPLLEHNGAKISSTSIREDIRKGEVDGLVDTLGRRYEIQGEVVEGLHNGRRVGFPTLNLSLSHPYVLPRNGVYIGIAYLSGIAYKAIVNVGFHPTVGALKDMQVEAHLLDYDGDAYGKRAYLSFYSFLREEREFSSLEELAKQLSKDKASCQTYFTGM